MKTRLISALVALPLLIVFVVMGNLPLKIAMTVVTIVGLYEIYKAFSGYIKTVHYIGFAAAVIYLAIIDKIIYTASLLNVFITLYMLAILIYVVLTHESKNTMDGVVTFFGFFYVCFLLSHVYLTRQYTYGKFFVWLVFFSAFGCDVGAYFSGRAFGKHKLIEALSPKKTVEGAIGGVVTAVCICVIYGVILDINNELEGVDTVMLCLITGFVGSIFSQIGDLAASAMKRYVGIKDFGKIMPGHGGVLDRFDSVLFTAPVVYYSMFYLINTL
ncbi:phosphatidate cytidylyltransferase [Clostridiales bacterium]|nr:phosphatidate cytidylyltransferase [Clostridiales bacterium]